MIRRNTWLLLAAFLALLAVAIIWNNTGNSGSASATVTPLPTPVKVFLWDATTATALKIFTQERSVSLLEDKTGQWMLIEPPSESTDNARVESAIQQLAALTIVDDVEPTEPLSVFGLEPPHYTVEIRLSDSSQQTLFIGAATPTGNAYYAQTPGRTNVMVLNKYSLDTVIRLLDSPPVATPTPSPSATPVVTPTPP